MKYFERKGTFCFAWYGGRFLILFGDKIVDFGDGGLSRGRGRSRLSGGFNHSVLGNFLAVGTRFNFIDHDVTFDFAILDNSYELGHEEVLKKMKGFKQ